MSANGRVIQLRKRIADYWSTKGVLLWLRLAVFNRRLRVWMGGVAVSLFGFATAGAVLWVPQIRIVVDAFQPLEAILSQLGATYGTILALILTLSIIPIQRAGEVWSPSIVRLYRSDPVTYITFVALGVFCTASFLLAVRGLAGIPVSIVLACSLVILGISLDILRWYHGHVCQLLDPTHAVSMASRQVKRTIDQTKSLVTRIARHQHQLLSPEQRGAFSVEDIETTVYPRISGYPNSINSWINDLAEIAIKAVARNEKLLAKAAVFAIAELTIHYLSSRKHNLTVTPAPEAMFLAMKSDVDVVTNRAYEALQEVSRAAVSNSDESSAIRVSEAFQAIAIHISTLGARAFREHSAPLAHGPIYYAFACVKYAQSKALDEVPFQSAAILSRVAISAPKDIAETDIHIPIIDGLYDIAGYLYGKASQILAEEIIGHFFSILAQMLQNKDYYFRDVLRHVLEKIELLAPLAIINEAMASRLSMVHPLGKAYGLINPNSLGYLFGRAAAELPRVGAGRDVINPYHDLIDIADVIGEHLRNIAEKNEFGESFLLWDIDGCIKQIAKVIAQVIDHPLRPDHGDERELIDKFHWILSFYWAAFKEKKGVSRQRVKDCGESLVFIGLTFLARGYSEVLRACISNIRSIVDSYCETAQPPDYYTIGDLLAHLWAIRKVLVAQNNVALTQLVDEALNTKPSALTDEQWRAAEHAIRRRREQLEERLAERGERWERPDSAETILRRLLREAQGAVE